MADKKDLDSRVAKLEQANSELSGMLLATGILLTQLLQANCKRELNPQAAAGRIMDNARKGIDGFAAGSFPDPVMKRRALEAVQQYEDQIRSVLAV